MTRPACYLWHNCPPDPDMLPDGKFEKPLFLGFPLKERDLPSYLLNQQGNRDRIRPRLLPKGTQIINTIPDALGDVFKAVRPKRISELEPYLTQSGYEGIILAQILFGPIVDVTKRAQNAFRQTLYRPDKVERRLCHMRAWTRNGKAIFQEPDQGLAGQHGPPDHYGIYDRYDRENSRIQVYNMHGSIVRPDTPLNRATGLDSKQGRFSIAAANDMYPGRLNHYDFDITFDGVTKAGHFDTDPDEVRYHRIHQTLLAHDPEAAEVFARIRSLPQFGNEAT